VAPAVRVPRRPLAVQAFDGTHLHAQQLGPAGARTVVLCHGLALSASAWGIVPELLARHHRVVLYDLRGHGASERAATGDYGLHAHVRDFEAVLATALDAGEFAVAVGHSFGGGVVLAYSRAAGDSSRLGGAVFVATSGSSTTVPWLPAGNERGPLTPVARAVWLTAFRALALAARRLSREGEIARAVARRLAFGSDPPVEDVRFLSELLAADRPEAVARTIRTAAAVNPAAWASALRGPALVLAGAKDSVAPLPKTRGLAQALQQGRLVELPEAGHMPMLSQPARVAAEIAAFLRELPAG